MLTEPKRNIFDIDDELDRIAQGFDELEEGGEEFDFKAAVIAYFGDLIEERDAKIDSYGAAITIYTNKADVLETEIERLSSLAKTYRNRVKRMKNYLKFFLEAKGLSKIETAFRTFAVQKNGGKVPVKIASVVDPTKIPERFQKVTVEVDTDAVRAALQAGEKLDFAELGEVGSHVRMK